MNDEQKARVIANCEVIAKALREGKTAQFRNLSCNGQWHDENFAMTEIGYHLEYRIKPEPRTIWVNEYNDGSCNAYFDKDETKNEPGDLISRRAVEYREVLK